MGKTELCLSNVPDFGQTHDYCPGTECLQSYEKIHYGCSDLLLLPWKLLNIFLIFTCGSSAKQKAEGEKVALELCDGSNLEEFLGEKPRLL